MLSVFQLEGKVEQGERDFEQISKTIRKEVSRFEVRTIDGCLRGAKTLQNIQQRVLLFLSTERKSERLQNHHCEISGVAGSDTTAGETTQTLIFLCKTRKYFLFLAAKSFIFLFSS